MNNVEKGDVGEAAILLELTRQGLRVFTPWGNGSRVDLICMDTNGIIYKVQCKYTRSHNESAPLELYKSTLNPKYNYHYKQTDVDIFALYVEDWNKVAFIKATYIFKDSDKRKRMTFRQSAPQGRYQYPTNIMSDYSIFPVLDA